MMRSVRWNFLLVGVGLLAGCLFAQNDVNMEISGFRVPEYDEQGNMTSQLFGDKAEMFAGGEVKITGLRGEIYQDGEVQVEVRSPYCFYNRQTRQAHSDAPVEAVMDDATVQGVGFQLNVEERNVQVFDQSKVTIQNLMDSAEEGETATAPTVITSKKMTLEYKARTVLFEENVHVDDSQLTLDSDALKIRFSESNEIDWIEATGTVRILSEGREAYADTAVYNVQNEEFLLEGNPRLVEGRNTLYGERIRFWRTNGARMVVEPAARAVIFPDEKVKKDIFE